MRRLCTMIGACLSVVSCATSPLDTSQVSSGATPSQAVESISEVIGERVQWGGHIVSIRNQDQITLVEVLSYPLARDGLPNTYRKPTGRFLLRREGFLEPQDYAPGRLVTVVGPVRSLVKTSIEQTELLIPLVQAEQLRLWDLGYGYRDPRPRFGIGVGISVGF